MVPIHISPDVAYRGSGCGIGSEEQVNSPMWHGVNNYDCEALQTYSRMQWRRATIPALVAERTMEELVAFKALLNN